jgi:hypothetical protein
MKLKLQIKFLIILTTLIELGFKADHSRDVELSTTSASLLYDYDYFSTDALPWMAFEPAIDATDWTDVNYFDSLFVAFANWPTRYMTSADGKVWEEQGPP